MKHLLQYQKIFALFLLIALMPTIALTGDNADKLVKKIQKKYDSMKDVSISFTQQTRFGVTKTEQTFSGKLSMKKGNKFLIEMEHQKIITDGKSVWSINKLNKQVVIDKYRDDPKSFSPDKILINIPQNYNASLLSMEKNGDQEINVLKLIPKDVKVNYRWLKVWVSANDLLMNKIQIFDISDNLTTYSVNDIKFNQDIPDSQFQYEGSPDIEVIDLRQ
ncbi:MAG: outer membrane lipoprotein carrier protein LolA [Ignavibacteriales bacterium]|nr:outer membrane lipoprotein carrier protein LolA [Ignavibacteriales bacterium]